MSLVQPRKPRVPLESDVYAPDQSPLTNTLTRKVIGTRWFSRDNVLYGGSAVGETSYGNSVIRQYPVLRQNGRILQWIVRPEDAESYLALVAGGNPGSTHPITDGYCWLNEFGRQVYGVPGKRVDVFDTHYAVQPKLYLVTLLLFDRGAAFLRSTIGAEIAAWRTSPYAVPQYPQTVVDYVTYSGTQSYLTPYVSARQSPNTGESLRGHQVMSYRSALVSTWQGRDPLATFADRFDGSGALVNGWTQTGTWERQNGAVICTGFVAGANIATHPSGMATGDGHWLFRVKLPASGSFNALCILRQSGNTYIRLVLEPTAWRLQAVVNGVFSYLIAQSGYTPPRNVWINVLVMASGTRYNACFDDVPVLANWTVDTDMNASAYTAYTGIGIGTFEANTFFDDVQAIPLIHALPTQAYNALLPISQLKTTTIDTRTSISLVGFQDVVTVKEYDRHAVRVRAQIRMPASVGFRYVFVGTCMAYLDEDNWFVVRLVADHDPVLGQSDNEIEVLQRIAGTSVVVGKVQFPRQYYPNTVMTLDSQIDRKRETSWVHIYLNGDYVESYPLPAQLGSATKHGYYRNVTVDTGSVIESGTVYA